MLEYLTRGSQTLQCLRSARIGGVQLMSDVDVGSDDAADRLGRTFLEVFNPELELQVRMAPFQSLRGPSKGSFDVCERPDRIIVGRIRVVNLGSGVVSLGASVPTSNPRSSPLLLHQHSSIWHIATAAIHMVPPKFKRACSDNSPRRPS
jgi:hypothetical protein